ncbi:MAG: hypothetical protein V3V96_04620, partial [Acidiferrobacterales bacterium]
LQAWRRRVLENPSDHLQHGRTPARVASNVVSVGSRRSARLPRAWHAEPGYLMTASTAPAASESPAYIQRSAAHSQYRQRVVFCLSQLYHLTGWL